MDTTPPPASLHEMIVDGEPIIDADEITETPDAFAAPLDDGEDAATAIDTEGL